MKTELKIILETGFLIFIAAVVKYVVELIGVPTTYDQSLLVVILCRVARLSIVLNNKNN